MSDFTIKRIARREVSRGHRSSGPAPRRARPRVESLEPRLVLSGGQAPYLQTNLVSDIPGLAQVTDSNLVNPWGVSFSSTSPFWVSNQGTGTSSLYSIGGGIIGEPTPPGSSGNFVNVPPQGGPPHGPTGQVFAGGDGFTIPSANGGGSPIFIFATLDGSIEGWVPGDVNARLGVQVSGAVYTGLAVASTAAGNFLYAANDSQGTIDVFDQSFAPHSFGPNTFVDPELPKGLVPFNLKDINGNLYVTYAPAGHAAQVNATPGQGAVAVFTSSGQFLDQLNDGGTLASPWGIALAPAGFGSFSGDLLVGNFAAKDSVINAFDPSKPSKGAFRGTLTDASGHAIENPGLWTVTFGNGGAGGDPNTLYFTAGIDGETHGLFGSLQAIPPLSHKAPIVPNLPNGAFQTVPTVPANGDVNPYGVAFVPDGFPSGGLVKPGDVLVSNFNASSNLQGTGSTIVDISPNGSQSLFFQDTTQSGLTTALGVLKSGFVIVGNLPTTYNPDGSVASIGQGSLRILDSKGNVVSTLSDSLLLDGPWDLTVNDQGSTAQVFVSNVLNGVVTRVDLTIPKGGDPIVQSLTRIASGYLTRTDPAALVVGPTGLAYDAKRDLLYVASTGNNEIFAVSDAGDRTGDAGTGKVVYKDDAHLRGPLGLVLAPNGDLITTNGDAVNPDPNQTSELVEFTPNGKFVGEFSIDPSAGGAFGLAVTNADGILRLAAVEDVTNSLDIWTFQTGRKSDPDDDFTAPVAPVPAALTVAPVPAALTVAPAATPVGTTDPSASANPSDGSQATDGSQKGVAQVALAGGKDHHSVRVGRRHPRGHKHKVGAAGHSTPNPISYPGY